MSFLVGKCLECGNDVLVSGEIEYWDALTLLDGYDETNARWKDLVRKTCHGYPHNITEISEKVREADFFSYDSYETHHPASP